MARLNPVKYFKDQKNRQRFAYSGIFLIGLAHFWVTMVSASGDNEFFDLFVFKPLIFPVPSFPLLAAVIVILSFTDKDFKFILASFLPLLAEFLFFLVSYDVYFTTYTPYSFGFGIYYTSIGTYFLFTFKPDDNKIKKSNR